VAGFDDSKKLTEETRERMFADIKSCDFLGWNVIVLSAKEISGGMLQRSPYNLNAMSHDTAEALIRQALADGVNLKRVFVDTVGDPERYEAKLSAKFPQITMTVRKKADSLFPIVSAASICAKVTRDVVIKQWQYSEADIVTKGNMGSGYPAGVCVCARARVCTLSSVPPFLPQFLPPSLPPALPPSQMR
jgi:ribonuclease H2 subunit A